MTGDKPHCSFCGKHQHEVRKLVAGPTSFICNECTDLAHDIVHQLELTRPPQRPPVSGLEALHLSMLLADAIRAMTEAAERLRDYQVNLPASSPREPGITVEFTPGWAEGVASPDEDVGFVFTRLSPDVTGLPVAISIGDDTPLVIAAPRGSLTTDEIAAVRHWVVRHREALSAHWRGQIDSMALIDRLRGVGEP